MRALNSRLVLIDINTSWQASRRLISATATAFSSDSSSSFRRTRGARQRIASSKSPASPSPLRKPSDGFTFDVQLPSADSESSSSRKTPPSPPTVVELDAFLEILPPATRKELVKHEAIGELIEVVMDLGRKPLARFPSGDWVISEMPVTQQDLKLAVSKVGDFSDDNRSGINRSLHRISAIRNRKLQIIGLTCRVGRAVSGSAEIIRDLIEGGGSILVIGSPEIARMLADEHRKRVVIVDTSNEIGGDGDVPHSGIGRARRMQVPNVNLQHDVMIEAVENHMPETIIIDEIGTELEALAASTIAQRGVQLVATAHGMTIDNIIKNPSLQILIGGIESVTLGDEEARKRKVQKTILERKGPPTFTCAVEMISRTECRVHQRLDVTVDAILAGKSAPCEIRQIRGEDDVPHKLVTPIPLESLEVEPAPLLNIDFASEVLSDDEDEDFLPSRYKKASRNISVSQRSSPVHVYTYNVAEADLLQVAEVMGLEDDIEVTDDVGEADVILASSSELKQNPSIRRVAKLHKLPIFVIKSTTIAQMVKAVRMILGRESFGSAPITIEKKSSVDDIEINDDAPESKPSLEELDALEEVRLAIEYIVIPGGEPVELLPRRSDIIVRQLELVESYQLAVENLGTHLNPRLQILPRRSTKKMLSPKKAGDDSMGNTVTRLPFLKD
uniref:AAA+ ATPase domain-containing protein n=1 Tax=Brassica campestris TaxID=3711 RepID=M4EM17_BRACM